MINSIFIRKFSDEQLKELFDLADADHTGGINFSEFKAFIKRLDESATNHHIDQIRRTSVQPELEDLTVCSIVPLADEYKIIRVEQPEHWRLLYCGGSKQVAKVLKEVASEHQIPLSIESVEW